MSVLVTFTTNLISSELFSFTLQITPPISEDIILSLLHMPLVSAVNLSMSVEPSFEVTLRERKMLGSV